MRRRMYFLLPDTRRAKAVFKELLLARIEERHIKVLAKEGTPLGDLPEATFEKTDAVHAAGLGLVVGGVTGALVGFAIRAFGPAALADLGLVVVLAMAVVGAVMGLWAAGMIGSSTPNTHLEKFGDEIARGKLLMIVDVPAERADEVSGAIKRHHPEADMRGFDPTLPHPFP